MAFYDLTKAEREALTATIKQDIKKDIEQDSFGRTLMYFSDEDTYIRKAAYLAVGKLYDEMNKPGKFIVHMNNWLQHDDFKVRQTVINAVGEIGKKDFESVVSFFDQGLFDQHHSPRNAVIGSIKKMGEVNPKPVLKWAANYLHHPDKEIRREICHGIELRGRKHPEDILPMLQELEMDTTTRVRTTLVHVLGQIAYKKGCLEKVVSHLKQWQNKPLVQSAFLEIIDVHERYKNFSYYTQEQAIKYIEENTEIP